MYWYWSNLESLPLCSFLLRLVRVAVVFVVVVAAVRRKKYKEVHMATLSRITVAVGKAAAPPFQSTAVDHKVLLLLTLEPRKSLELVVLDLREEDVRGRGSGLPDEDDEDYDKDEEGEKDRSKVVLLLLPPSR